jgi:hypothetical protein
MNEGFKGPRGIGFVGFIGLMKRKRVEGSIPMALSNTINPKNPMNIIAKVVGFE